MLSEPTFAASYLAACASAPCGAAALRWLALAPERPGAPERHRAWFLVALPGNLVALELVSEGAHATYCYRAAPRPGFTGGSDPACHRRRGDRPGGRPGLGRPRGRPLPARADRAAGTTSWRRRRGSATGSRSERCPRWRPRAPRYVARLVHRDEASWKAALDDLISWHAACRDDAAAWPGRTAQEAEVAEARR